MRRRLALTAAVLAAVTFLSACGDDDTEDQNAGDTTETSAAGGEGDGAEGATLAVTAQEADGKYSFDAPATVAAGVVTIEVTNSGQEPHQAALVHLEDGKTRADFEASLQDESPEAPEGLTLAGGVSSVSPGGGTSNLTQELEAGNYLLICEIPGPDGKPHAANGMISELTVEAGDDESAASLPEADVTITAKDFTFDVGELKAGEATIGLENAGPSIHEVVLIGLQDGKKAQDVIAFFSGPPAGPPPFKTFVGGLAPIANGGNGVMSAELTAGPYALLCFVATPDGQPHFALGMAKDITVA